MIEKIIRISIVSFLFTSSIIAQSLDTDAQNNGVMTIGNGTGTLMQFAGAQEGTDDTNQAQGGFGIVTGSSQISPVVWMYGNTEKNAFQVKRKGYGATVQSGATLFQVGANGNVGIGTINPNSKLHIVNGSSGGTVHGYSELTLEDDDHTMMNLLSPNTKIGYYGFSDTDDDFVGGMQYYHNTDKMEFRVNNHQESDMVINKLGNIGIGTTTPDAKLAVNGNIHTKEVKVDLIGWADYVFKEDYKLPTLQQVEDHIIKNGHLINIPSATEVAENGIQLGKMNAKLLEKIEELTLYTIAQEKKLKEQEKKLIKQEDQITALKSQSLRINKLEEKLNQLINNK
ncbi:hypothetical protein [uncultured Aquimarina sp.]|uniref:hypothetical protein n=1 Tax=uncultured Aquimarina sp. TaxID=575652 RepID=UPI002622B8F8|nr:hypothetical protein [uncultured Aquimarina sp.]